MTIDDYDEAVEVFYRNGWTDGLPVVMPTRRRVEAMIAHGGRDPQESLGPVPPKGGAATMLDPTHNLNGVLQTTHMCVSLVIVNGPIARRLRFNSRDGVFGNGYRANGAVGRAVRLALWNLSGAFPWDTDKPTLAPPPRAPRPSRSCGTCRRWRRRPTSTP